MTYAKILVIALISGDLDERQFDPGQFEVKFDALQIWRKKLMKSTICRKVQFDKMFLTKDNLTKYLKLFRNIL